jgi:hypothetical protein
MLELLFGWIIGIVMAQELRFPNVILTLKQYVSTQKPPIKITRMPPTEEKDDDFNMD